MAKHNIPKFSRIYCLEVSDQSTKYKPRFKKSRYEDKIEQELPYNMLCLNKGLPRHDTGDFIFWLDINNPNLLNIQEYACEKMGVSFV